MPPFEDYYGPRWLCILRGRLAPRRKAKALADYHAAKTPQQERNAYRWMRWLGFPPSYGEPR